MPIVFEEVSGEVVPERSRDDDSDDGRAASPDDRIDERVRAVLARDRHRAERLSDR